MSGETVAASSPPWVVRHEERLAIALAATAGFVDAHGFIHYHAYLSYMSGNTTLAGIHLGRGELGAVAPLAAAIFAFVAGAFSGTLFFPGALRRFVLALIAAALALIALLTSGNVLPAIASIIVIAFTMGALNTSLPQVGRQSINLTFVTGTLNRLGKHLAYATSHTPLEDAAGPWDSHWRRALQLGGIWCGFILGSVISAAATPWVGTWALLLPALSLAVLCAVDSKSSPSVH